MSVLKGQRYRLQQVVAVASMQSAPAAAVALQRRPQRERRANSRYEDGVDPEDEAALLSGKAPAVGQKRKAGVGAAAVFGSTLSIPRRARSSRYARDGDSDQSGAGGFGSHAAAAALQFNGRPVRTGSKRQAAAAQDDQAVAELLLGMGDIITQRTDSPTSSSDGGNGGGAWQKQKQRVTRLRLAAKGREQRDQRGGSDAMQARRQQKEELPPPPPGKRRAAVAAVSAIAAAAASDKAPSDDEAHLGLTDMDAAPAKVPVKPQARPPPKSVPRGLTAVMPPAPVLANGDAASKERSRLAGSVAPENGFAETLSHVHQVKS